MTRYFMTIPEACQLVLQAGGLGKGGDIFILEMGTPVKIDTMARDLIRLSGKEPDLDIKIVYTGLRPGEKLFEELITHGEGIVQTEHEKIMVLRRHADALSTEDCERMLSQLIANAQDHDSEAIKKTLKTWIAEYTPSSAPSVLS
jgi:FlaA1/EpsC-like NDP-sugar epimerase